MPELKRILPYIIILLIAAFLFKDIFAPGILTKSDNAVHVIEADYVVTEALPKHHWINGWYQYESAGMPLQLYFYQLGYWLIAFLYFTFNIPVELAYKIVLVFAHVFPALALYLLLSRRFGGKIAFFPALFYLFQRENARMFLSGMWNNGIGLGFLILFWHFLDKYHGRLTFLRATMLGLLFGLVILGHYFTAIAAACLLAVYYFMRLKGTENILAETANYAWILLSGALLTLFYTYPFIETSGWISTEFGWGLGNNIITVLYTLFGIFFSLKPQLPGLQMLMSGDFASGAATLAVSTIRNAPLLAIDFLAILGFFHYLKFRRRENNSFLNATIYFILALLVLGSGFWFLVPQLSKLPFLSGILAYRFLYYGRIGLIILAAYCLARIWQKNSGTKLALPKVLSKKKNKIAFVLAVVFSGLLLAGVYLPTKAYVQTFDNAPIRDETFEVWAWLSQNVPDKQTRILQQSFFDNIKEPLIVQDSIFAAAASYYTNLSFIGAWATTPSPVEQATNTEGGKIFNKSIEKVMPEEIAEKARTYNIKYFVAVEPKLHDKLSGSGSFVLEKRLEHFAIFSLKSTPQYVEAEKEIMYAVTLFEDQKIVIDVANMHDANVATIKTTYHPYWRAYANGKELELGKNEFGMMQLNLPAGNYALELVYVPTKLVWPALLVLAIAFASAVIGLWRRHKHDKARL